MFHNRRARPTLKVISDHLTHGWEEAWPKRSVTLGAIRELQPVSELPHPLIAKAVESFGHDKDPDNPVGLIRSATTLTLHEIKVVQWRGGVWKDPATGVHWLIVAGLAKGEHQDRDDFYERIRRLDQDERLATLLPSDEDASLLRKETGARVLATWLLGIQNAVGQALARAIHEDSTSFTIRHPSNPDRRFGAASIEVRRDELETVTVTFDIGNEFKSSSLSWEVTVQVLVSISPPEQDWDVGDGVYFVYVERGFLAKRVDELCDLTSSGLLAESRPGKYKHFAHRTHIAGATVAGSAVVSMCGCYFVPSRNPDPYDECPRCREAYENLSS